MDARRTTEGLFVHHVRTCINSLISTGNRPSNAHPPPLPQTCCFVVGGGVGVPPLSPLAMTEWRFDTTFLCNQPRHQSVTTEAVDGPLGARKSDPVLLGNEEKRSERAREGEREREIVREGDCQIW